MQTRHTILLLALIALTLHATIAFVSPPASSETTTSLHSSSGIPAHHHHHVSEPATDRQVRVLSPLATLASFFLGSSPAAAASSAFVSSVDTYFPGAQPTSVIVDRVVRALRREQPLLASSICSDEINETPESLLTRLQAGLVSSGKSTKKLGIFHLGGLGGLPFVGVSGMGAMLQHVPQQGSVVIVFGPHVGISESGGVGKVQRAGMPEETSSCGAAVGAYQAIQKGKKSASGNAFDYEEDYIIQQLKPKLEVLAGQEAQGGDATIAAVTNSMYEIVFGLLKNELDVFTSKKEFWDRIHQVTLVGGIIINRSSAGEDYFQPITMTTINADQGETSTYDEVFGDLLKSRGKI